MREYLAVAIGGALGSVARFWFSGVVARHFGETFPWGTLLVNVSGSLVIGFFATLTGPDGRCVGRFLDFQLSPGDRDGHSDCRLRDDRGGVAVAPARDFLAAWRATRSRRSRMWRERLAEMTRVLAGVGAHKWGRPWENQLRSPPAAPRGTL